MTILHVKLKGGKGSGNHGHSGRPGMVGGSGGGGRPTTVPGVIADWYKPPKMDSQTVDTLDAAGPGDAAYMASQLGYDVEWSAFQRDNQRWTMGAEQDAKYDVEAWIDNNPNIRALTLYDDYSASTAKLAMAGDAHPSFKEWLDTPQVLWRGGGRSEPFMSFARSKRVAEDASGGDNPWWIEARPSQWYASGLTGAGEVYMHSDAIESVGGY